MITNIYRGGLGNQLFEIMTGYFLAKQHGDTYAINPNLHMGYGQGNHITSYGDSIFKNIEKTSHRPKNLYKEPKFNYTQIEFKNDLLLDGFFQTEKYFLGKKQEINTLLDFKEDNNETNICSIHIRTGDYIGRPEFDIITPKYFLDAVNFVLGENPNIQFKVISDDRDKSKIYIPSDIKYEFCSSNEIDDLKTISSSDYAIISNSSFGWWGSYLGKDKTTIVPSVWFRVDYDVSDVYRDNMVKINV